jgi:small subunit ribosomal protein S17e
MTMGRIKTKPVKSAGDALLARHGDRFSADFGKNKEALPPLAEVRSKKMRNMLAGYLTKQAKKRQ